MAGLLRPQAAASVDQRAAQPVRPAGARAHPRHPGRAVGHLSGGMAGRRQRRRRCLGAAGGHHQPARAVLDRGRCGAHRVRHRAVVVGGVRSGAVLGGAAKGVRAVRIRDSRADGAGVSPRDPRRPVVESASAGDRARAWRPVRGDRGELRRRGPGAGPAGEGDSVEQGGRRSRTGLGRGGCQRRRIRC